MRKIISFFLNLSIPIALSAIKVLDPPLHWIILIYSLCPLLAILMDVHFLRLSFREIKHQKFRLIIYALSFALFFISLLSCFGLIPIMRIDVNMTVEKGKFLIAAVYLAFALIAVNLAIILRDKYCRDSGFSL